MLFVKVTYTVKPEFIQRNQENINLFMADFKKLNSDEFRYTVFLGNDGKTFIHVSMYQNEEIQKRLLDVPLFKSFQKQRDESGLEGEPEIEVMNLVASSHDLFN